MRITSFFTPALIALMLAGAGCAGSTSVPGTVGTPSTGSPSGSQPSTTANTDTSEDVCARLPDATLSGLMGAPAVTHAHASSLDRSKTPPSADCSYASSPTGNKYQQADLYVTKFANHDAAMKYLQGQRDATAFFRSATVTDAPEAGTGAFIFSAGLLPTQRSIEFVKGNEFIDFVVILPVGATNMDAVLKSVAQALIR